jgi:hypothetical protein
MPTDSNLPSKPFLHSSSATSASSQTFVQAIACSTYSRARVLPLQCTVSSPRHTERSNIIRYPRVLRRRVEKVSGERATRSNTTAHDENAIIYHHATGNGGIADIWTGIELLSGVRIKGIDFCQHTTGKHDTRDRAGRCKTTQRQIFLPKNLASIHVQGMDVGCLRVLKILVRRFLTDFSQTNSAPAQPTLDFGYNTPTPMRDTLHGPNGKRQPGL